MNIVPVAVFVKYEEPTRKSAPECDGRRIIALIMP